MIETAATGPEREPTGEAVRGVTDLTNCSDCGGIVGTNEQFCSHCGATLSTADVGPEDEGEDAVPTTLSVSVGGETIAIEDGTAIDDQLRQLLRDGGRHDQAKWIDDGHLVFQRGDDGFTLSTHGDNLTRLNGDRVRPGESVPVEVGDEIEVSGFLRLTVEQ